MSDVQPPDENPILKAYESFVRETPLVTRYLLQLQAITWILSFFIELPLAVGNVPHFTIFNFEIYRIILSPFVCPNFISLIFAFLSFGETGRRMEHRVGSAAFGILLLTIGMVVNTVHLLVAFALYGLTQEHTWLFLPSTGIWIIVFGVLSIECAEAPSSSMRRLFFLNVPARYYPLALLGIFSLLGGFQLAYLLSIGVGFAYQRRSLDVLKPDNARIQRWEQTILESYTSRDGWVSNDASIRGEWNESESPGGLGLFSSLLSQQNAPQPPGSAQHAAAMPGDSRPRRAISTAANVSSSSSATTNTFLNKNSGPSFPTSGGHQLGTTSRRNSPSDPRQARLEALERRLGGGQNNNDDRV